MGLFDKVFKQDETAVTTDTFQLNLEKPLTLNLIKGMKSLDMNKQDVRITTLCLLDVSGSMADKIKGIRKIDSLRDVMKLLSDVRKICFSNDIYLGDKIPEPYGNTYLEKAFRYIAQHDLIIRKIILVSDGEPNDTKMALHEAIALKIPVDVIYIGAKGDIGERFMKELAVATGGQQLTV